jgi:hypothetical protein
VIFPIILDGCEKAQTAALASTSPAAGVIPPIGCGRAWTAPTGRSVAN